MHIGIVLHPYNEKKPAGLARYAKDFTAALIQYGSEHTFSIFVKGCPARPDFLRPQDAFYPLGNGLLWLDRIKKHPADIVVFNTPRLPLLWTPKKSLAIILDFAYALYPAASVKENILETLTFFLHRRSLRKTTHILSISGATKRDAIALFGVPPEKISVVYPGFSNIATLPEEAIEVPEKYFLYVGVVKKRKNLFAAIQAYKRFLEYRSDISFVVVGASLGGYASQVKSYIKAHDLSEKVHFLDAVSDRQLSFIYKRAFALVFPSLIEGFGFTVLEAMAGGVPVITSNRSSLKEVAGNAALLVDPERVEEIAAAMRTLTDSLETRSALIAKGKDRTLAFSWEKCAKETLSLLKGI